MELSSSKGKEPFPSPPPYYMPDESKAEHNVRIYHVHSPFRHHPTPPPSLPLSPGASCSNKAQTPLPVSPLPTSPRTRSVSHETELCCSPGLTMCPSCQTQVTTQVTHCVGTYAWLMCLVFVLCGLVLGCCLIPFFVKHFKDTYHTCPNCQLVLHIHKKTCC